MSEDVTVGRHAETGRDEPPCSRVPALLATVKHIVDNPGRTENARRLLLPVLISLVLVVTASATVVVLAAPAWTLGAIGAAGTGAVVSGYRRRVSRAAARRSRC